MKARLENSIVRFYNRLPERYFINGVPHNLQKLPTSVQNDEGFFNVIIPVITQYQRMETLLETDFNGSDWVYRIYNFNAQEIIDQDDKVIENTITQNLDKYQEDGEAFFKKIGNAIRRKYNDGDISTAQYKGIRVSLQPALQPLRYGDWDIAQDNVNAITPPTNQKLLLIYNLIKDKIDIYVQTENF